MTLSKLDREENNKAALLLMFGLLGDDAIDIAIFLSDQPPFAESVLRTTWEDLLRSGYVAHLGGPMYRLTAKGWLYCLEVTQAANSPVFMDRFGRILAALKKRVKGRTGPALISHYELATELQEPLGWIFNVIDSRATSDLNSGRIGAGWYQNERGRLIEIPVDFNMQPLDIAASFSVQHLQRIEELEERLREVEEDRAQFHCPHCDARMIGGGEQDFPEHHCIVTYEHYACGMVTADGEEDVPCPYGPRWPRPDEFDLRTEQHGNIWLCYPTAKTPRAGRVHIMRQDGATREEAESKARAAIAPKQGKYRN
jgi:hypothetical protein